MTTVLILVSLFGALGWWRAIVFERVLKESQRRAVEQLERLPRP